MTRKLSAIKNAIQKAFPDSKIEYREKKFHLHKFRIDREGLPPCWLYFAWEYLLNHSKQEVLERLMKYNIFEILLNVIETKRLAIGDFGVQEVDDYYGRDD